MSGGTVAAVVIAAIGTAVSYEGSVQQASAQKAAAKYQSQVADSNQQLAIQNANFAAVSGEQKAAIQEQKTRAQVGAIAASQGSSGVDVNSPTSTAVRTSQGELGALDAQTIRANAARAAYGFETQATNFGNQSSADISQGDNAETAGDTKAAGGLLSSAGNASLNFSRTMGNANGLNTTDSDISRQDEVAIDVAGES